MITFMKRRVAIILFACTAVAPAAGAADESDEGASGPAQTTAEAIALFHKGIEAFAKENYPDALLFFTQSYELNPNPNVLYNIGMCQRALFEYAASVDTLQEYLDLKGGSVPPAEKKEIKKIIVEMEKSLATLEITVSASGAAVRIDGKDAGKSPLPGSFRLDPGGHEVEVKKDGYETFKKEIILKTGEKRKLVVTLYVEGQTPEPAKVMETGKPKKQKKKKDHKIAKSPVLWGVLSVALVVGGTLAGVLAWKYGSEDVLKDGDWIIHGR
jgi:tetratricopeptide (TPR) repeat protein